MKKNKTRQQPGHSERWLSTLTHSYITVTSAEALNCDTLTSQSQDAPSEVVRRAWARLLGLLTAVKVNIGNKGPAAQETVGSHYLK